MSRTSPNLGLDLPLENEYFNIDTWNRNMRILDEAYALLKDPEGGSMPIPSSAVSYDNLMSNLDANNVQDAIDELAANLIDSQSYEIDVNQDKTITIDTFGHVYIILHFGETVYNVNFIQSMPGSGLDFVWEGGQPIFQANSTYELSFLRLDCKWFVR